MSIFWRQIFVVAGFAVWCYVWFLVNFGDVEMFFQYFIASLIILTCVVMTLFLAVKASKSDKLFEPWKLALLLVLSAEMALVMVSISAGKGGC